MNHLLAASQAEAALADVPAVCALRLLLAVQAPLGARAQQLASGWLTDGEHARMAAMQRAARRQEFLACRYALRHLLSTARGTTTDHWRLDAPEGRAPHLNAQHHGVDAAAFTHLSLSHSGAYLACAVGSRPVGIDLEVKDVHVPRRDVLALAAMACTDGEMEQLQATSCEALRYRSLLQIWSLKEAYFKGLGRGVDFSSIRCIECRPRHQGSGNVLAYARSWLGITPTGLDLLLSVCVFDDDMPPFELHVDANIEWHGTEDWSLVSAPPSVPPL